MHGAVRHERRGHGTSERLREVANGCVPALASTPRPISITGRRARASRCASASTASSAGCDGATGTAATDADGRPRACCTSSGRSRTTGPRPPRTCRNAATRSASAPSAKTGRKAQPVDRTNAVCRGEGRGAQADGRDGRVAGALGPRRRGSWRRSPGAGARGRGAQRTLKAAGALQEMASRWAKVAQHPGEDAPSMHRWPARVSHPVYAKPAGLQGSLGGVSDGIRTRDRRDHNPELYQLSYAHQGRGSS